MSETTAARRYRQPHSFTELLRLWPTVISIHRDTGYRYDQIRAWRDRNWLPEETWEAFVGAAQLRGFRGVNLERLGEFRDAVVAAKERAKVKRAEIRERAGNPPAKGSKRHAGRTAAERRTIGRRVDRLDAIHPGADAGL
jgi:hypothetical protein